MGGEDTDGALGDGDGDQGELNGAKELGGIGDWEGQGSCDGDGDADSEGATASGLAETGQSVAVV